MVHTQVPVVGVEPTIPKALVSETSVYASSTTRAKVLLEGLEPTSPKATRPQRAAFTNFAKGANVVAL